MYFHKIDHPANFAQINPHETPFSSTVRSLGDACWRITIDHPNWTTIADMLDLIKADHAEQRAGESRYQLRLDADGITIIDNDTKVNILSSHPEVPIGKCGQKWLFTFCLDPAMRFYGMGEKNIGFEKSGMRTKFWNTDVWADFSWWDIEHGTTDPMYASFPIMLVKNGGVWIALMIPTSAATFMDTGARQMIEGAKHARIGNQYFYLGAIDGTADLVIAVGTTAKEVTTAMTQTLGLPPVPPLWALGHHQSRWGYGSLADAARLDEQFALHDIPCDAIWFDIDYMDNYRLFTFNDATTNNIDLHGRKLVAILDPGIKVDSYDVCTDGLKKNIFCQNSEQLPYVGFVWPGASYFPDFFTRAGSLWWAEKTRILAEKGLDAFWIDMNDPSTGSMEVDEMLFDRGAIQHHILHNWYGSGMAKATVEGLMKAYPDRRPFTLTRSAMLGSHLYGALWTGDSMSNYHHLRKTVEMTLSLSMSTMAFVGCDVGGFGGNTDAELLADWYRTCILFPFIRNHSADGTHRQEPWEFGSETERVLQAVIRLRYAFLPYLYNLMYRLHAVGEPIIRPMLYDDNNPIYEAVDDQFTIGEALLQAPKLERGQTERTILIPNNHWLDLQDLSVVSGPCELSVDFREKPMPLFLRQGCIVPIATFEKRCVRTVGDIDIENPIFLCFPGTITKTNYHYLYDDKDGYNEVRSIAVEFKKTGDELIITISGGKSSDCLLALYLHRDDKVTINGTPCSGTPWELPFADAICCEHHNASSDEIQLLLFSKAD
ncbi:MAG: glycoside hydrolase family 31 protein [Sphaerochaetaceae bacterium]|nr:glycoside hydrolase family 31 protein [Sphaerochaetaceae bacterium]